MQRFLTASALAASFLVGSASAEVLAKIARPVPGQPTYVPAEWHLVASHTHSSTGIGKYKPEGLAKILELAADKGFRMVIVTDHNTLGHWFDPGFGTSGGVTLVRGEEWTSSDGHATLVDYSAASPDEVLVPCDWEHAPTPCADGKIDYAAMAEAVHARGGLLIVNHPRLARHHWPDQTFGAHGVEVNRNLTDIKGAAGRAWWHARLSEGARLAAIGGSDWHYWRPWDPDEPDELGVHEDCATETGIVAGWPKPSFDDAVNLVRMGPQPSVAALKDAIKARRVLVLGKPDSPKIFLGADLDGDGKFEDVREGDTAPATPGPLKLQVRVLGGKGEDLKTIVSAAPTAGGRVDQEKVFRVPSNDFVLAFELARGRPGQSFFRAEIGGSGEAVSNPIFY